METPTRQRDKATEWNRQLAGRVTVWKRWRAALAILLCAVGITNAFFGVASVWSVPCFVAALIAYLLYLDAREQAREVNARKWNTITPTIASVAASEDRDPSASRPPN